MSAARIKKFEEGKDKVFLLHLFDSAMQQWTLQNGSPNNHFGGGSSSLCAKDFGAGVQDSSGLERFPKSEAPKSQNGLQRPPSPFTYYNETYKEHSIPKPNFDFKAVDELPMKLPMTYMPADVPTNQRTETANDVVQNPKWGRRREKATLAESSEGTPPLRNFGWETVEISPDGSKSPVLSNREIPLPNSQRSTPVRQVTPVSQRGTPLRQMGGKSPSLPEIIPRPIHQQGFQYLTRDASPRRGSDGIRANTPYIHKNVTPPRSPRRGSHEVSVSHHRGTSKI